jgi:hypothetical protein
MVLHVDKVCKSKIDRFMQYTVCCLLGTTRRKQWKGCWMIVCCKTERYINEGRSETKFTIRVFGLLIFFCCRTFHIWLCCSPTAFPRSPRHNWDISHIKGPAFLFPVIGRCFSAPCHSCFQFATIFKFLAVSIWVHCRKRMISARQQIILYNHSQCTS